jgi:putative Mn2+ efflux pump MntP
MGFGSILLLGIGLAMDATAVAAARGLAAPRIRPHEILLVAGLFGGFQALMPLVGWLIGSQLGPSWRAGNHWVAFVVLSGIGGKMLWESRATETRERARRDEDPFGLGIMLLLAVATSIDALAVGVTLPMLGAPLVASVLTIGITTGALSAAGLLAGRRFGVILGKRLDAIGGVVLIGLGVKFLVEHLRGA